MEIHSEQHDVLQIIVSGRDIQTQEVMNLSAWKIESVFGLDADQQQICPAWLSAMLWI
jgi:hypothetical protein